MACRSREFSAEDTAASASLSDILLFTTMSIIGFPVDVHVKDGSIYSGIFHTASVDNGYGVVLKQSRRIKKGKCDTNVEKEGLIETLVISSDDLVQVVAKEIMNLTSNDYGISKADIIGAINQPQPESCNRKIKVFIKDNVENLETTQTPIQAETGVRSGLMPEVINVRNCSNVENGELRTVHFGKDEEASNPLHNVRQVKDIISQENEVGDEGILSAKEDASGLQSSYSSHDCFTQSNVVKECQVTPSELVQNIASSNGIASSTIKMDTKFQERPTPLDTSCLNTSLEGNPGYSVTSSTTSSTCAPQKISSLNTKEFKLNPGAKVFCPSFSNRRSVAPPPAVAATTNIAYMPDNFPLIQVVAAKPEIEFNSFNPHSSLPVKVIPSGNLIPGNRIVDTQFSQMIAGQAGSRAVPVRYAGQYQTFQGLPITTTTTTYSHPNYQNVMVGRLGGQLVYMQPTSHDMNQVMPPHPVHLPKHQAQTYPICVTAQPPPLMTGGQPQFGVPNHNPLLLQQQPPPSLPPFQVFHSIIPGSNGIFGTKLQ
ncbi:polyadenylate-binding protein-interacting protein 4-like [Impatiens glandulifera]|uniref:polyadenylate-binding protein-interacting protein 4-like n=1 Tax=Impatiens glandulifera TaxID=253017 RepID=UPI001FB0D406|nr:polyadenylate-binding protein-interacting protein 4-like [Impatiens glandulifera]